MPIYLFHWYQFQRSKNVIFFDSTATIADLFKKEEFNDRAENQITFY